MNDALIKQLANKAGCDYLYDYSDDGHAIVCNLTDIEKLVELIVKECAEFTHPVTRQFIMEHFGVKE